MSDDGAWSVCVCSDDGLTPSSNGRSRVGTVLVSRIGRARRRANGKRRTMASIISNGIGSGLDIAGIVQQLVACGGAAGGNAHRDTGGKGGSQAVGLRQPESTLAAFRDRWIMRDLDSFLTRRADIRATRTFTLATTPMRCRRRYGYRGRAACTVPKLDVGCIHRFGCRCRHRLADPQRRRRGIERRH